MTKPLMNEAERFLLENWEEARRLEECMEDVRTKYKALCQRVVDDVAKAHPRLDGHGAWPTQFSGSGAIAFWRTSWPGSDRDEPPGLWIWNLRLELLTSEAEEPPIAAICVARKTDRDLRAAMTAEAIEILGREEFARVCKEGKEARLLEFVAPSKDALLNAIRDDDGQPFVDLLRSQFDLMVQLVPTLDSLFQRKQKSNTE